MSESKSIKSNTTSEPGVPLKDESLNVTTSAVAVNVAPVINEASNNFFIIIVSYVISQLNNVPIDNTTPITTRNTA
jgi:hypothetical protein